MPWEVKVKKRLGEIEKFDRTKVTFSIFKAAQRVGGKDRKLAEGLAKKVEDYLKEKFPRRIITTDEIGNAVEKILIEEGHTRTAKTFILYREGQRRARKKLIKFKDLPQLYQFLKLTDRKIVFTSGVFDLFHIGHARYLKKASLQGDILVVGLNSDESARGLKGEERPILGEEARAEMLSFLEFVDFIVIFSESTAASIISKSKPDIYVCVEGSWKGNFEDKPEVQEARKCGSQILVFPSQSKELSTSEIINKIQNEKKENKETKKEPDIQLAVAGFLVEDGKMLLVKQKNHQFWTAPGGLIDQDETPEKACRRELKEEIDLDVIIYGVFPSMIYQVPNLGKKIVVFNYLVRRNRNHKINTNTLQNKNDTGTVEKWKWAKFDDAKKLFLAPNILLVLEELEKNSKFWQRIRMENEISISSSQEDWFFIREAQKVAEKSTCLFRKTGCVLVRNGEILLSAYNQVMPDEGFCERMGCIREELGALPGEKLELCTVLHAEANLLSLAANKGISLRNGIIYLTTFPCPICAKAIANSGISRLVFLGDYSNQEGLLYLQSKNIHVVKIKKHGSDI